MADAQQFIDAMRESSGAQDPEEALRAGLAVLGERLGGAADELAAQLPSPFDGVTRTASSGAAPRTDDRAMAQALAQRLNVDDAAGLDVLQGTMRAVAIVVEDDALLKRIAAELPASLKPAWDPPADADRFRTAQTDAPGRSLRA
ncbi:DUF2267 domain-containing protein [Conexibacter sp. SYSU D00693]|uniref:DUF2267 domain-containing protein n=1 Tax=Conexibacter sp. SYSU D00693 TaxID=2812560 RepID=UPI00196A938E|nr:DUF2267 domain-containing protein [Conexibacter sp. SYSU D00693]